MLVLVSSRYRWCASSRKPNQSRSFGTGVSSVNSNGVVSSLVQATASPSFRNHRSPRHYPTVSVIFCCEVIRPDNRIIATPQPIPPTTHAPYPPPPVASSSTPSTSLTAAAPPVYLPSHLSPHPPNAYTGAWPYPMYQAPQHMYPPTSYATTYPGYFPTVTPVHQPPPSSSNTVHGTYRSFRWQQPYAGPKTNRDFTVPAPTPTPMSSHGEATVVVPPTPHLPS